MDKPNVYPYNGNYKKEQNIDLSYNIDEPWKHYAKWKKPDTKDRTLYNSIYSKCPEQANLETN